MELHEYAHSSMQKVDIQKPGISISLQEMPEVISPTRIPMERQKYLYEQIMFCDPEYADITRPQPESNDLHQPNAGVEQSSSPPSAKRARLCGHCRLPGYTKLSMEKLHVPNF